MLSIVTFGQKIELTALDTTTIYFEVQFASGAEQLDFNDVKYKDLKDVRIYREPSANTYRYTSGSFRNLDEATEHQNSLINRGLTGSFVTAFKNGRRIPLSDVPKYKK
jgi:N-acetylmuramoyl-L-alanine amidase